MYKRQPQYRGDLGPLKVSRGKLNNPLFNAWLDSASQAGYPLTTDFNGQQQEGAGPFDQTIYRGRRQSTAEAYLKPVSDRPNLTVLTRANVDRIIFNSKCATGVECRHDEKNLTVCANREVILSCGAINTPQLMMLSGIGDADHLAQHGIKCLVDRPDVGKNLQDHL